MRKVVIGAAMAGVAAGTLAAVLRPAPAASALRPGFTEAICLARPPVLSHAWARDIQAPEAGSVVGAADAVLSNEDQADFLLKLGLMEGHLMVGRELVAAGQPTLALPHFGHPVRELYDDLKDPIEKRGLTQFDGELVALEAIAAAQPMSPAFAAKYDQVLRILAAARATVPSGLLNDDRFMAGVFGDIAETAAGDYGQSIEAGRIRKPVEYHDSRGYLAYAVKDLARLEARPEGKNNPRLGAVHAALRDMQAPVSSLLPPDRPRVSIAAYRALAAKVKATQSAPAAQPPA